MSDETFVQSDATLVAPVPPPRRPASRIARTAAGLAILLTLVAVLSGFGSKLGIWHFRVGFTLLRWSAMAAIVVALLSLYAAIRTRPGSGRRGFPHALIGLVLSLVVFLVPWSWQRTARSVPPIHDISTDTNNPPQFVAVVPLRSDAPNPVEYGGPEVAAQQRQGYPDIQPVVLDLPADRAFQRALDAANEMGWEIVASDPASGRIEATDETFWFGFEDDVVIRLTPLQQRTILDVRSLSRVGGSDVGTNAGRIRDYLEKIEG